MEGDAKLQVVDRDVVYDFDKEREIQMIISCFKISNSSKLKRFLCITYISFVWVFLFYQMCMGFYSIVLTMGNKTQLMETLHMAILTFYAISNLTNKLNSDFEPVLEIINKGFYTYDEKVDESHYEIRKDHVRRIRLVNLWFRRINISSGISFLIFNTAKKYIESSYKPEPSSIPINPYFPIPFYMPFDTNYVSTFTIVYLGNVGIMFCICMVTVCIDEIYISLIEQMNAQFEILNLSISKLVDRATRRYMDGKTGIKPNLEDLYQKEEFQDCLFKCLRENIRHHQVLLKFTGLIRNYIQMTFFLVVVLASLTLALAVLFITRSKLSDEELLGVGTFVMMLLTELVFTLQFCWYGEEIANESCKIFSTLWTTPWWKFDKRVKVVLSIMMLNTRKPFTFKTTLLSLTTSLESFISIISSAYQVGNVMLNME